MIEIEFIIRDKKKKKMIECEPIWVHCFADWSWDMLWIAENKTKCDEFFDMTDKQENYNINQYTWLKDKHWKKIFVRYIIKFRWSSEKHEVVFDENVLQFRLKTKWVTHLLHNKPDIEIIGHIYENKDLIK